MMRIYRHSSVSQCLVSSIKPALMLVTLRTNGCLLHSDIYRKFEDLCWMESVRAHEGRVSNDPSHRWAVDEDLEVKARNRYANVQAWANSRIHLRVPEGACDYTNASPIVLEDTVTLAERRYIASQVSIIHLPFPGIQEKLSNDFVCSL